MRRDIIKCNFKVVQLGDVKTKIHSDIIFRIEFKTLSKNDWKMNKINLPDRFREQVIGAINKESEWLERIIFKKKLNNKDREDLKMFMESAGSDITINELIQEIKKLLKQKELLLADVSHELRTPLAKMRLLSEIDTPSEKMGRINKQIDTLDSIITNILICNSYNSYNSSNNKLLMKIFAIRAFFQLSSIRARCAASSFCGC